MLIPDANVLIYATDSRSPAHATARAWLEQALVDAVPVGFSWVVLLAFIRLVTKAALFEKPLSVAQAMDVVDAWLSSPASVVLHPGERHPALLRSLLMPLGSAGNLSSDAHLAALALEHGALVVTYDRDFGRFPGVRSKQPSVGAAPVQTGGTERERVP